MTPDNFRKGLKLSQQILGLTRQVDHIAAHQHLDGIRRFTNKLINNDAFRYIEIGVGIGNSLVRAYDQESNARLFNRPPSVERSEMTRAANIVRGMR